MHSDDPSDRLTQAVARAKARAADPLLLHHTEPHGEHQVRADADNESMLVHNQIFYIRDSAGKELGFTGEELESLFHWWNTHRRDRLHAYSPMPLEKRPPRELASGKLHAMLDEAMTMAYATGSVGTTIEEDNREVRGPFNYKVSFKITRNDGSGKVA